MARKTLTPEQTTGYSIFQLPGADRARVSDWLVLLVLGFAAWAGAVAYLGPFRPTPLSRAMDDFMPLATAYWVAVGAAGFATAMGLILRDRGKLFAGATVTAFLLGFQLFALLQRETSPQFDIPFRGIDDAIGFALFRANVGVALVAPMLLAWLVFGRGVQTLGLGIGNLFVRSRTFSAKEKQEMWLSGLFTGYLIFVVIMFALMQGGVGFAPVLRGTLWPLLTAILIASLVNATVEEVIFRGFVQPAFIAAGGVAAGLWVQGLLFGLFHWGSTVGFLAALPMALAIGFGSVIWGKAAYETRGLLWPIIAHFMIDVAIMAAFFVPT